MNEIPKSHCQLMPSTMQTFCESYNCQGRVAYAIGVKDGPMNLWRFLCKKCALELVASIPEELFSHEKLIEAFEEFWDNATDDQKTVMLEEMMEIMGIELDESEEEPGEGAEQPSEGVPEPKKYTCQHCGEPFDTPQKLGNHVRNCPAKAGDGK